MKYGTLTRLNSGNKNLAGIGLGKHWFGKYLLVACGVSAISFAHASSDTWANTATGTLDWDTATNWTLNNGTVPGNTSSGATASADVATFNKTGTRTVTLTSAGRTILGMTFSSGAGAHTIGSIGYTMYLSNGGTIQVGSGVTNGQAVNANLRIVGAGAAYTFSNTSSSGPLTFGGTVSGGTAGATVLTLDGTYSNLTTNRINGIISNGTSTSLAIVKNGSGSWGLFNTSNSFTGGVTLNAGTLNLGNGAVIGTGTLRINGGTINAANAVVNSNNNAQAWNGDFTFGGSNTLNLGTGNVTMNATRTVTTNGSAALTVGGVISGSGFGLTKAGTGTMILGGNSTYTGATTVSAGTLLVNGTLASGSAVTVGSSGTLGGSGTINGTTVINGTLAPGNSPGVLTFNGPLTLAGTTNFELNGFSVRGTDFDGVNTGTGLLTLGGSLNLNFGATATAGTLDLFNIGSGGVTGDFSSVNLAGLYSGALSFSSGIWSGTNGGYDFSFNQSTGDLNISAVPEPSTCALVGMGLGVLWFLRRKQKQA